jgi:ParB-like chromosome segregation protein Spo0J
MKDEIEELMLQWKPLDISTLPQRLPLDSMKIMRDLYQPRGWADAMTGVTDERHTKELARNLKQVGDLDPIQIIPIGERFVVLDGHHRLEAYRAAEKEDAPVVYFQGNPKEALLEAGAENIKERLAVTPAEKTQRAWKLVISGLGYSKSQIVKATQAADGTVGEMRRVLKWFELQSAEPSDSWSLAKWKFKQGNVNEERPEFDHEAMLDERANWTAQALRKRFPKIKDDQDALVFARGITGYCSGHYLPLIARELMKQAGMWDGFLEEARDELKDREDSEF